MYSLRLFALDFFQRHFPSFRTVHFRNDEAVATMALYLRQAWVSLPSPRDPPVYTRADVITRVQELLATHGAEADVEVEAAEILANLNPDLTVHTPWRDTVYAMWNHVFNDVARFLTLSERGAAGHFHAPNHDVVDLRFGRELIRTWDSNVLIISTFLGNRVKVSMYEGERRLRTFDGEDESDHKIWWLKAGTEVKIVVEGEGVGDEGDGGDLAAVLVVGALCTLDCEMVEEELEDSDSDFDPEEYSGSEDDQWIGPEEDPYAVTSAGTQGYVFENSDDDSEEE